MSSLGSQNHLGNRNQILSDRSLRVVIVWDAPRGDFITGAGLVLTPAGGKRFSELANTQESLDGSLERLH